MGASLLLKSSGFSLGDTPGATGDTKEIIENIGEETAKNYDEFSGFTKINFSRLRAKNAKGFPENVSGDSYRAGKGEVIEKGTESLDEDPKNNKSFGSTYNSAFRFQGSTLKLHKIQAAISMIALKNIGQSFWQKFIDQLRAEDRVELSASTEKYVKENTKADVLTYMLGRSRKLNSLKLDQAIFGNLLTNTTYAYGDAVDRGLEIIFGKNERNDIEKVSNQKMLSQSPGFWLAISRSILKSLDNIFSKELNQGLNTEELFTVYKEIVDSNKFIQFFNVLAVIGDISLQTTGGVKTEIGDKNFKHHRDVDAIPDNRAIPGKSRQRFGLNKNELSWKQDAPSSMYILPANIIRAASRLNNTVIGESPVRGMLGSNLAKSTYFGVDVDGSFNRIPNEVVKVLEDKLDAEYVPFYIQDLRTNEIISFNAFLSTLTDSINPQYSSVNGYGRMDPVQIYQGTTRTLSVSFTLFATNREDYDNMWYKINKLVTLLYPQYTPGTLVSNGGGSKFYQPFSQVIGASPIVRLRIGDVIKSNYSRFGLARTFGIGDVDIVPIAGKDSKVDLKDVSFLKKAGSAIKDALGGKLFDQLIKVFFVLYGSPTSFLQTKSDRSQLLKGIASATDELSKQFLVNGFANPLGVDLILSQMTSPDIPGNPSYDQFKSSKGIDKFNKLSKILSNPASSKNLIPNLKNGYSVYQAVKLQPSNGTGYAFVSSSDKKETVFTTHEVDCLVIGYVSGDLIDSGFSRTSTLSQNGSGKSQLFKEEVRNNFNTKRTYYELLVIDDQDSYLNLGTFYAYHEDILPNYASIFTSRVAPLIAISDLKSTGRSLVKSVVKKASANLNISSDKAENLVNLAFKNSPSNFMNPINNPVTRAFETSMGRGLAGVLSGLDFSWLDEDYPWDTSYNSRAPRGAKISFNLDVIHDIPPGLDHSGFNRAPLYNVGSIMESVAGDPNNRLENAKVKFKQSNVGHARRFKEKK